MTLKLPIQIPEKPERAKGKYSGICLFLISMYTEEWKPIINDSRWFHY